MTTIPASFAADDSVVATGPDGQLAHRATFEHMERLQERLYDVTDGVWCLVGNGLSNQTFVEGPAGLIAIDTGESCEEMAAALAAVRRHTDAPIAAVIYTHFHYCNGTTALLDHAIDDLPIWGHAGIEGNLRRQATEVAATAARGLVHQFGVLLPPDGPDGLVGAGLGRFYRNPAHGRATPGFVAPNHLVTERTTATIAGLQVELLPAPSDADDSITIWFPELAVCVNNLVWPALFNVFPIRGEEYRDPRVLLTGIDEIVGLGAEHLLCTHGPPLSGADDIAAVGTDARDAIQFIWDQTVRGLNRGLTFGELIEFVQLPERFERTYFTQQHYGLVEHHVRQVVVGLRGWFDGDEATLFPLPTAERAARLVEGFGGVDAVRAEVDAALACDDVRWALELASWPVRADPAGGADDDRHRLAEALRAVAHRTTAANIRNWCLTRALELDGRIDLSRFRTQRYGRGQVLSGDAAAFVHGLRVLLDPQLAGDADVHVRWRVTDGPTCGLHLRRGVAVPTDGDGAPHEIALSHVALADLLGGAVDLDEALATGSVRITGDQALVRGYLAAFEVPSFAR